MRITFEKLLGATIPASSVLLSAITLFALAFGCAKANSKENDKFLVEEATIDDIQQAIQSGKATCQTIVQAYLDRVKAYNGICTQLVSIDGKPVSPGSGYVRSGSPLVFPEKTISASSFLPNLDQYAGIPLELGRMEATASDPSVQQQYGMVMGWQNSGQLNALETINIRGERSVACKAECDLHPSKGALPKSCPAGCDAFRQQPDAIERAKELDVQYGNKPDLKQLPLYCTTASIKNWYDVKDMRSTGGNDVNFALDAAPQDSTVVAALRNQGAIIFGVSIAAEVGFRGDGPHKEKQNFVGGSGSIRGSWSGHVCNPYDTERSAGPSSGGAGASVSANLVTFAVCETTGGSCREPASQNAVASLVTTKGLMSEYGTATAQYANHRPGILTRKLSDAARILDAITISDQHYFDSADIFTAIPRTTLSETGYEKFITPEDKLKSKTKPLAGLRIGIVREFMVKHTANDAAINDLVDAQIKTVLRDQLGADIVESLDPQVPDDPSVANMAYSFQDAFAEVIAIAAPEYLAQMKGGSPEFAVAGYDVTSQDYRIKLALRQAPLSDKLNMRRIMSGLDDGDMTEFSASKYLMARGDARVFDLASYAQHSKWRADSQATGLNNVVSSLTEKPVLAEGIDRIKMREVFRMAILKVMYENKIDIFVHPNMTVPQWKIGIDREPTVDRRRAAGPSITDLLGSPEIIIPAGFDATVYEPTYVLNADKKNYTLKTGTVKSTMAVPMPFSINFWAGPGDEPVLLKAASAYEAATQHRIPPAKFAAVGHK